MVRRSYNANRVLRDSPSAKKSAKRTDNSAAVEDILRRAPREALPAFIPPALATRVDKPPPGGDWVHEIKLDGYRLLARKDGKHVTLLSRNNLDWTTRAADIAKQIALLPVRSALLDGELVVFDPSGVTHFQSLQNFQRSRGTTRPAYVAFDLLHLNGRNTRDLPLTERKELLRDLLDKAPLELLQYSPHTLGNGPAAFDQSCRDKLEGIISKRADSRYLSVRTKNWLKIKCENRQEFVLCGFTPYTGGPNRIGSLLLSVAHNGGFTYAGKVGTGYSERDRKDLFDRLSRLKVLKSPVRNPPSQKDVTWIRPLIVAQITFREFTADGHVRQAVFQGLREDLKAKQVQTEPVIKVKEALK